MKSLTHDIEQNHGSVVGKESGSHGSAADSPGECVQVF